MRVDTELEIGRVGGHLDGEDTFGDELTRTAADDADAENPLGARLDDELRDAIRPIDRDGAAERRPRESRDFHLAALSLGLGLLQAAPGDLRVGEAASRNGLGLKYILWPRIASTATRASCDALCANIGSPTTSPIAKMEGSAVRRVESTVMNPRWPISTLVLSSPGTAEFGLRPTETSTRSNVCVLSASVSGVSSLAPATGSIFTVTPLLPSFISATRAFSGILWSVVFSNRRCGKVHEIAIRAW